MKLFARYIPWGLLALSCVIFANKVSADAFAQVPADSVLYTQLAILDNASWEHDSSGKTLRLSKSTELTRYEFAIEVAKSAIDFNARHQANPAWLATVPRSELRSLRALLLEFSPELVRFNVATQEITDIIDEVLRSPASDVALQQTDSLKTQTESHTSLSLGAFPFASSLNLATSQPMETLSVPLSKQFELYAQLTTPSNALLHAAPRTISTTDTSSVEAEANSVMSAGANMSINDWLSLRAGYVFNQQNQPQTLQQTLLASNRNSWFSIPGSTGSIGGGLDVKVSPGLTLSGEISRLSLNTTNGLNGFSGTQLEGGVGVRGLNNRLLLSARLAHLMPDDSSSLASTAARLNLDYALSSNLSLNLLYQQMFSLSPSQDGKSTFAGGVNIHF